MTLAERVPDAALPETPDLDDEPAWRRRLLLALGAATVAFVAAVVGAILPANVDRSMIDWSPAENGPSTSLTLAAIWPEWMTITLPCEAASSADGDAAEVATFQGTSIDRGLELTAADGRAAVVIGGAEVARVDVPSTACSITATFEATGDLRLSAGANAAQATLERAQYPRVAGLAAKGSGASDATVRLLTRPVDSQPSGAQIAAWCVAALAAIAAIAVALRNAPSAGGTPANRRPSALVAGSDVFVALVAAGSTLLTPPYFDDGWTLATVREFPASGYFSTYYWHEAAPLPQGSLLDLLLLPWFSSVNTLVALRLPMVAIVVLTFWLLRRRVIDQLVPGNRGVARAAAAGVFAVWIPSWLTTLRAEPVIALLGVVALAAVLRFVTTERMTGLVVALAAGAAAVVTHQSGWVVVGILVGAVPMVVRLLRGADRRRWAMSLASASIGVGALAVVALFLDSDLTLMRDNIAAYSETASHSYGFLDEWVRFSDAINTHPALRRWSLVLAVLAIVASVAIPRRSPSPTRVALWCCYGSLAGLLATSSKWPWHYGSIVPGVAVCSALVANWFVVERSDGRRWVRAWVVLCAIGVAGAVAFTSSRGWNVDDLTSRTWSELHDWPIGAMARSPITWVVLASAVALVGRLVRRRRHAGADPSGAFVAGVIGMVALALGATWGFLVNDNVAAETWTPIEQNLSTAVGDRSCGLVDELEVVTTVERLLIDADGPRDVQPLARAEGYWHDTMNSAPPFGLVASGTFFVADSTDQSPDVQVGTFVQPWVEVGGAESVAVWSVGSTTGRNRAWLDIATTDGSVTAAPLREVNSLAWTLHTFDLPANTASVRVRLADGGTGVGEWLAATPPVEPSFAPMRFDGDQRTAFVPPQRYLYVPCVRLPSIKDGFYEPFSWSLGLPEFQLVASEYALAQMGCMPWPRSELCWVRVSNAQVEVDVRRVGGRPPPPDG